MGEDIYRLAFDGIYYFKYICSLSQQNLKEAYDKCLKTLNHLNERFEKERKYENKKVLSGLMCLYEHLLSELTFLKSIEMDGFKPFPEYEETRVREMLKLYSTSPFNEEEVKKSVEILLKNGEVYFVRYLIGRRYKLNIYITEEVNLKHVHSIVEKIFLWLTYFCDFEMKRIEINNGEEITNVFNTLKNNESWKDNEINLIISSKDVKMKALDKNFNEIYVPASGFSDFDKNIAFSPYFEEDVNLTGLVAIHEIAHLFGLEHCENTRCIMNVPYKIVNNREKMKKQFSQILNFKTGFCNNCLGKLEWEGYLKVLCR